MKRVIFFALVTILLVSGCVQKKKYFEKVLNFPENITSEQKIKLSAYVVPTLQQYNWQQLELTAFIHFGMNTFTGREWGDGKEDPALFNPTDFDAEQWVTSLKEAGFNMLILTAKHHDGFCLWPTKTTAHSVASSLWRDGKGDVVKEVKDACDKHDMKFGVYLSPWDRNAECYGDSPRYNEMFIQQLTELLTNYGQVYEVWFDGANGEGPNGKVQQYDWKAFYKIIEKLQPKAVKAIMGNDVRWVGNEKGLGRETEWSVTPYNPETDSAVVAENDRLKLKPTAQDLGSRTLISEAKTIYWYPSEVDVSIRPGWFYHPEQDYRVKTLQQLVDIYYKSVGMNSVLLLNIPPDTRGRLHEVDVERLKQLGSYIGDTFKSNKLVNGETAWAAKQGESKEYVVAAAGDTINTVMLQEDILKGQRVESFSVEGLFGNEWKKLAEGTTIGYKRLLRFDNAAPSKIKITITETRDKANIKSVGAYYAPAIEDKGQNISLSDIGFEWKAVLSANPLTVDIGQEHEITGFTYNPPANDEAVYKYRFWISQDGKTWTQPDKQTEFGNIKNNPIPQFVRFASKQNARYFKFESVEGTKGGKPKVEPTRVGILTK